MLKIRRELFGALMKPLIALLAFIFANLLAEAATNETPRATNVIYLNAHQQFYRAVEMRRSQLKLRAAQINDPIARLNKVISAKGWANSKPEQAELKKYQAAMSEVTQAERALDIQVAEYELHNADARQWANWWVKTNAHKLKR